jgi:hypothetical protein
MSCPWWRLQVVHWACPRALSVLSYLHHCHPWHTHLRYRAAIFAARDLIAALQHPVPASPFATLGDQQLQALTALADIFNNALHQKSQAPPPTANKSPPTAPPRADKSPPAATPDHAPARATFEGGRDAGATNAPLPNTAQTDTTPPGSLCSHLHAPIRPQATPPGRPLTNLHCRIHAPSRQCRDRYRDRRILGIPPTNSTGQVRYHLDQVVCKRARSPDTRKATTSPEYRHHLFIPYDDVPDDRTVTYGRIVVDIRPQKEEQECTLLTVGGNLIEYPSDCSTKTAGLTTTKILFNSTIATPNAKFMCLDVKHFYLNTPMACYEYMHLPLAIIPEEIIQAYDLRALAYNSWVNIEIRKSMYGLPQASKLANDLLQERLAQHGYHPVQHTHGLWRHDTHPIAFSLVVDDFGVKYVGEENACHLHDTLNKYYKTSVDWAGKLYCGITLAWDYVNRTVDLSMSGYIAAALHKFRHTRLTRNHNAPSR